MNWIPLSVNPRWAGSPAERAFHTAYVMFAPTATIAEKMWMYLMIR